MELWDAYNRNFKRIENVALIRGEHIPDGFYHLVCDVIVKHTDGTYLLMQRDFQKIHGGKWELTAGGSAIQGEGPREAAGRELKEETGITGNLKEIRRMVSDKNKSIYVIYLCETGINKDDIVLQIGETIDYRWVTRKELFSLPTDELISKRAMGVLADMGI